jgi:hypothetical protein
MAIMGRGSSVSGSATCRNDIGVATALRGKDLAGAELTSKRQSCLGMSPAKAVSVRRRSGALLPCDHLSGNSLIAHRRPDPTPIFAIMSETRGPLR